MVGVTVLDPGPWGGKSLPGQDELPSDDGEPMETSFHHAQGNLLIDSLVFAWSDRHDFYVAGNMFVYFSEHQIKRNDFRGPDVFVVLGTERKPRKSWVLWEEGGKVPDVVIEVTSESTKAVDRGEKMRLYSAVWRTPYYFIFDPETDQLEGYRLDVDRLAYAPAPVDERGDYSVTLMNLKLGLRQSEYRDWRRWFVRWLDPQGNPLPMPHELARGEHQRAEAEHQRAEAERQRAEQALARVRELEAQLARSKK